ncbi:MAG: hypothetical protein PVH11_13730 [Anaerolineae bacterium]|jgi:hypothetical protein
MDPEQCFSKEQLERLRLMAGEQPGLAAIYLFGLRQRGDCGLAALFTASLPWSERLGLELAVAEALELDAVELINLRRMPLVARFDIINRGEPLCVCDPEALAIFIEQTIARYAAFYPLLEALYWKVETGPLSEDRLTEGPSPSFG